MRFILHIFINALAVFLAGWLLSSGVHVPTVTTALLVAVVLGIVNAVIRPVALLLTLPINIVTLGLFTFVINAVLVLLVDKLIPGFSVSGFWWALLFSLVVSILSSIFRSLTKEQE